MMRFDRFTERAQEAAARGAELAQKYGHTQVDVEHILLALIEQSDGAVIQIFEHIGGNVETLRRRVEEVLRTGPKTSIYGTSTGQVFVTPRLKRVLDLAIEEASKLRDEYISTEHILLAMASDRNSVTARLLAESGVTKDRIYDAIQEIRGGSRITAPGDEEWYRLLKTYSRDLTQLAREGKLDPVIGRDNEVLKIIQILSQRTKNNPMIVGYSGVGKTAVVYSLAQRIATGDVPQIMLGKVIMAIDSYALIAGTRYRGVLEEKVNSIVQAVQSRKGNLILFFDDLQEHITPESLTVLSILQSAIARGDLQLIGAITPEGYDQYFKPSILLARFFAPLFITELSVDHTIAAVKALRHVYEAHHQIGITDEAIETAVRLSDRYIKDRYQPDKSLQIIDEAAAALHLMQIELPPPLKAEQVRLEKLREEEETAGNNRDYERAAQIKAERLQLEAELEKKTSQWHKEKGVPESLSREAVLSIVSHYVGIPKEKLTSDETPLSDLSRLGIVPEAEASTEELRLGEPFKLKYKVLGLIGRGGFGEVWRVKNLELDREEAIKVLFPGLMLTRKLAERFRQEARMAARLNHPNIVTIYDTGEGAGRRYIVMEYVPGPNLAYVIDQQQSLSVDTVQNIAIQVCDALECAHRQGVVHRDVKPSNLLLVGNLVKVADFGVSVLVKETMTEYTGMGGGTPSYKAPEQIRGGQADRRTDIYSLGVTLYELLTGERPFHGTSVEYQHLNEPPLPPSHLKWQIPPSVDEIILRCLKKDPMDRYQSAAELRDAWSALMEAVPITPLANLMRARFSSKEPPYTLVLGEGASLSSGCSSMMQVVDAVLRDISNSPIHLLSWSERLQRFLDFVQNLSATERYSLLKRHYEGVEPSIGYISLAKLVKAGYFDTIFTTNFDSMLDEALRREQMSPQDYRVFIVGEHSIPVIHEALKHPTPRIKVVKLHGDINVRKFALTPQEIFVLSSTLEGILAEHLCRDVLIVGHEPRDEDITRCLGSEGGALWYVHPHRPSPDSAIARTPRLAKSHNQVIWGDNGHFDRFFALLCRELLGEEPQRSPRS